MPLYKDTDASSGSLALGMTYAEAEAMVRQDGFMFEYLPKVFQTKELRDLSTQWWEDRFLRFYDYYKSHPEESIAILAQAKVASSSVVVDSGMRFEVELSEIE